MQQQAEATLRGGLNFLIDLLGQDEEARKKNADKIKMVQRGQVFIDGIKEVAGIWAGYSSMGPLGIALAAIQSGIAVGRTLLALKNIDKQKYAVGGFTGDCLFVGSQGLIDGTGQRVAGVVHQDEWVAPAWMVQSPMFADTIGYLETARQMGAYQDGGGVSNQPAQSQQLPVPDMSALVAMNSNIEKLVKLFEALPHIIQVENSIVDQVEKIQQYNVLKDRSSIG